MSAVSNWRAVKEPHGFQDGTTHRWRVIGDLDGMEIEFADWLTEDTARLIAAAPALLEALEQISASLNGQQSAVAATIRTWADAAIAQAKGERE